MPLVVDAPMLYGRRRAEDRRPAVAKGLTTDALVDGDAPPESRKERRALLAALYIGCDMLDEAHDLCMAESYAGSDAAYLHALLHRREGPHVGELSLTGFQNSNYWWGVLGDHPLFDELPGLVDSSSCPKDASSLATTSWDPAKFVALSRRALDDETLYAFCAAVQHREWDLLCRRLWVSVFGDTN